MKRIGQLLWMLIMVGIGWTAGAAGPVAELYPKHLSFLVDFDDGTPTSRVGTAVCNTATNRYRMSSTTGLFGGTGLTGYYDIGGTGQVSSVAYPLAKGQTILDMTKNGTVLMWMRLNWRPDPVLSDGVTAEPSCTPFSMNYNAGFAKRVLMFRQASIAWGSSTLACFFETYKDQGRGNRYTVRADYNASYKYWEPGSWHLLALGHTPNSIAFSLDGQPFKSVVSTEILGALDGNMVFQSPAGEYCTIDDCAILDFKMSDDQLEQLYEEYQTQLQESPKTDDDPDFGTLATYPLTKSTYGLSLAVTNNTEAAMTLVWSATATPDRSQPAQTNATVTLAPGENITLSLAGVISGEENVVADVSVKSLDGSKSYFLRRRNFAPNSDEPEWMHDQSSMAFSFAYYPYTNTVHASVNVGAYTNWMDATAIRLRILTASNRVEVASADFPADPSGTTEIFWRNVPELDGEYVCRAEAVGIENSGTDQEFVRYRYEWEHNQLGLSDTIPEPFEPVTRTTVKGEKVEGESKWTVDGMTFDCETLEKVGVVLRDHYLDQASGLWQQVLAQDKPLLARPMQFVELQADSSADESVSPQSIAVDYNFDIDGLCEMTLTLPAGHYGPLALDIPLKAERARIMHVCGDGLRSNYGGIIPAGTGRVWKSSTHWRNEIVGSYRPYVWVGGSLRGLAVFGENDKGWVVDDSGDRDCQEIWREEDGTVVIRLNLIQAVADLSAPQTIKLGLQVTPVKPMMENWRQVSRGTLLGGCLYWGGYWNSIHPYDGTDEFLREMGRERETEVLDYDFLYRYTLAFPYSETPFTPEWTNSYNTILAHYRNGLYNSAHAKKNNAKLVFYTNGRGVWYGDFQGQGATFCDEWSKSEFMSRKFTFASQKSYDMDPSESFRDCAAWWYARMTATGAANGIYWDDVYLGSILNMVQTDAYRLPSGGIQPSSSVFNMRALIKRCAVVQAEQGKNCRDNWVHMTNTALAPICAFAGVHYDWEDMATTNTFQQRYSREYIQAVSTGRQMGNRVGIMGYFPKDDAAMYDWLAHTGVGVMLTHELEWNEGGHDEYKYLYHYLRDWGYRTDPTVQVWNYFDEDVEYPVATEGLTNSSIAMARPEKGEAFLVFSNFDDTNGTVRVTPDLAAMGFAPGPWTATLMVTNGTTAVEGDALAVEDGAFTLSMPRYDWAVVKIQAPRHIEPVEPSELPSGYDELLEFVETDGTQWFDTGFKPNPQRTRLSARFIPIAALPTVAKPEHTILFGVNGTAYNPLGNNVYSAILARSDDQAGYQICPIWIGGMGGGYHYPNTGSYVPKKAYQLDFDFTAADKAAAFVNLSHQCGGYYKRADGELDANLFIGDINNANTGLQSESTNGWQRGAIRWLGIQIRSDADTLAADFRPARKDGVVGFWDAVSDKFFASRGDCEFIGPNYVTWNEGVIPETNSVAVIPAGETRQVGYGDVAALNQLAGIRMTDADSSLVFTNGDISSVILYTPISGHGRVMNYESNPLTSCTLEFGGDNSNFDGVFVVSNAATGASFAPYAFGATNRVIIDTAKAVGGNDDRRRFSIGNTTYRNEFHYIRANGMFIGYGGPTVASTLYLDMPAGGAFHGNGSGLFLNGPIETTVTNTAATIYLNANITLGGGATAVKNFALKHLQGANPTVLGSPLKFLEHPYSPIVYNNCNYSWNSGSLTKFTLANVFETNSFVLCNYAADVSSTHTATFDLNGYDQQVGTLGVYAAAGFDATVHMNPNMAISSATSATLTICKTCRNDFAAGVYPGTIRGAVSICLNSTDATPGRLALNCPGSDTTGTFTVLRGEIEILPTATVSNLAALVIGEQGKVILDTDAVGSANADFTLTLAKDAQLEIASEVTVSVKTATRSGRRMRPGDYPMGAGTLKVRELGEPKGFKLLVQ